MLRHTLLEWQDPDVAVAALAACLGVLPTGPPWDVLNANKGLICSNNPTSNALTSCLYDLVEGGMLEENKEGQLRWNPAYSPR